MTPTRSKASQPKSTTRKPRGPRYVYHFTGDKAHGDRTMAELLGGKGANLAEMCRLGLPVPPGFTITTAVCGWFDAHRGKYPPTLEREVGAGIAAIEKTMCRRFGDAKNPLLLSIRSGAAVSMPGMMDSVLNLGLNEATVEGLARRTGNPRFAWDAYRRFMQMYGDVVLGVRSDEDGALSPFALALEDAKRVRRIENDTDLEVEDLRALVDRYRGIVRERTGKPFPDDPAEQLWGAIGAVFCSWNNERAVTYRALNGIPGDLGTAVNVQAMVFGNLGETSGTGVAFTRDPATGERRLYGEYLTNAQGEDVVAGIRTPEQIDRLRDEHPRSYRELQRIQKLLEEHYADMQDLEFTIEDERLFMLQCRSGKRTGFAAVRIATDMVRERRIDKEEALRRVEPDALDQLLQPLFDPKELRAARADGRALTRGLPAGPGAVSGRMALTSARAEAFAAGGEPAVLVRIETSPEDIKGMLAAGGILTARGGMTSHAALIARQMGKVCVVGAQALDIDTARGRVHVGDKSLKEGDWLSLDGTTGEVYAGQVATRPSEVLHGLLGKGRGAETSRKSKAYRAFASLMRWSDEVRTLGVRANADQPDQCLTAVALGAEGVGLCRTEHMFFGEGKIDAVREMILADDETERALALQKLLPLQRKDFEGIFRAMGTRPVTIRTLDPPLHEFLPHDARAQRELAAQLGVGASRLVAKVEALAEQNPMLGHRGCRLGITYPEITRMQVRAIFEAACNVAKRTGKKPRVELMIPLIGTARELELQATVVREVATEVFAAKSCKVPYDVGTMIELPRAALTAGRIAQAAEFFSFGTNDLTQTTFGISRDDAGKFVPTYLELGVYPDDPFSTLDRKGVGRLMRIAVEDGRAARGDLHLGICGEHGGDPRSIEFCQELGLDYVSCSPYRVPVARLAAARAALGAGS